MCSRRLQGFEGIEDFVVSDDLRLTFRCNLYEVSLMSR